MRDLPVNSTTGEAGPTQCNLARPAGHLTPLTFRNAYATQRLTRNPRCATSVPRRAYTARQSVDTVDTRERLTWPFPDAAAPSKTR